MAAAAIPLIISGISGLAGLFGGRPKTTYSDTTGSSTSSSTPNLTRQQQALIDQIINQYQARLSSGADLSGYAGQGLRQINSSSDIASKMSKNILASRGLSASPYAAYQDIVGENQRTGQSADFLNQLPLLSRQLQGEDLNNLMKTFALIPTGMTTSTSGSQHTVGTQPGNMTAGFLGGLGAGLGAPSNGAGVTNASAIAQALSGIFGKKASALANPNAGDQWGPNSGVWS